MKCSKCSKELNAEYNFCPNCGNSTINNNSFWLLVIGILFPIPALILYMCLKFSKTPIGNNLIKGFFINIGIQFLMFIAFILYLFNLGIFDEVNVNEENDFYVCNIYCEDKEYEVINNECVCEDGKRFDFEYK